MKMMMTPKIPMGRRKRMRSSAAVWSWVRSGSMTRTGWTWAGACVVFGVVAPAVRGEVSADVLQGGECLLKRLEDGGVDGGHLLLNAEPIGRQIAGDVKELAGDDVSDSADDDEGEDAGDGTARTRGTRRASRRLTAGVNRKASVRAKARGMRRSRAKKRVRTVSASTRKGVTRENSLVRACDMRPHGAVMGDSLVRASIHQDRGLLWKDCGRGIRPPNNEGPAANGWPSGRELICGLVRRRGLEPLCLAALAPQASASANFATSAICPRAETAGSGKQSEGKYNICNRCCGVCSVKDRALRVFALI